MTKYLVAKIASATAFLSTSMLLSGCAIPSAKPELCNNYTARCLKATPKKVTAKKPKREVAPKKPKREVAVKEPTREVAVEKPKIIGGTEY